MKNIKFVISLFIVIIVAFNITAQNRIDPAIAPIMTFEKTVHDWGSINEGDKVEADFIFTNTGKTDLIITNIKGSCGCTIPTGWNKEPIAPGATSKFTVAFNSSRKPGNQQNRVTITCNTIKGREFVTIKAQVISDPKQDKIRAERLAKRREAQALKKKKKVEAIKIAQEKNEATTKSFEKEKDKLKKATKRAENRADERKKELERAKKKAKKEIKRKEKEIKEAKKKAKKAKKEAKKAKRAKRKTEKAAKKIANLNEDIKDATKKVEKYENKLLKMQSKFEKENAKGKLSPNDVVKKELKMQKQVDKINKAKIKLQKLKHKL